MQESMLSRESEPTTDKVEVTLRSISQNIIVFVFGLLPLFFVPVSYIGFDYAKTIFVILGVLLAIIFFSLSVLRSGKIQIAAPLALAGLWLVALSTLISALLSGDLHDALIGDDFAVHTALFVGLLALVATVASVTGQTKSTIMRLYILLTGSAVVLGVFHLVRLLFGSGALSLGVFTSLVSTPIGGWNDLALFFGLCILLSLVALEQLPLTKWGKALFSTVVGFSLVMLAIVNFFAVWIVLGLVSLVVLMYTLTKDRFSEKTLTLEGKSNTVSMQSVILSVIVFLVSVIFIIGGGTVGAYIAQKTHISYIEVRPSFSATTEIARHVFAQNAFVGTGPNKFVDAWRMFKDPSINQTIFWATDFRGANGYITTQFVTTGILGMLSWLLFFGLFLFAGFKMLFRSVHVDRFWYFIGSSSFVAAVYLWCMSFIYVPGAAVLLLAGIFTSTTFAAYSALVSTRTLSFSIAANRRAGFVLVGVVMVIIVAATGGLYFVGQNFASMRTYGNAISGLQKGGDSKVAEQGMADAYASSGNEVYALQLASYQLAKINVLAAASTLTTEQQQELQSSVSNGINAAKIAVSKDPTDSVNWSVLGGIYSILAGASVQGAKESALDAFENARKYDPENPLYLLLEAQLASRTNDLAGARAKTLEAVQLKADYTDALFFLTQIDIAEGKTDDAIATTQSIVSYEPNNPARYYQLGVLLAAKNSLDDAITSFKKAIALDANYANARYYLALALAQKGDTAGATEQLQAVLNLNPGNQSVIALIDQLKSGKPLQVNPQASGTQVSEPEKVSSNDNAVVSTEAPNTSLVTPVNTVDTPTSKASSDSSAPDKTATSTAGN